VDSPGLTLLRQELAKHHVESGTLSDACLRDILACAEKPVRILTSTDRVEDSGLFLHYLKGLAAHVAGLLGSYGPDWPVPKEDVIADILRRHRN
jgi:hypothetical protein